MPGDKGHKGDIGLRGEQGMIGPMGKQGEPGPPVCIFSLFFLSIIVYNFHGYLLLILLKYVLGANWSTGCSRRDWIDWYVKKNYVKETNFLL